MGREIRRVPPNWQHPKRSSGAFSPMYDRNYEEEAQEWIQGFNSFVPDELYDYYWEYNSPPDKDYCVPYTKEEATWYQVYETVSEGTPVTPPFETEEELIEHLIKFGESLTEYWNKPMDPVAVRKFVTETHWAPSGIFTNGKFFSGIETCNVE